MLKIVPLFLVCLCLTVSLMLPGISRSEEIIKEVSLVERPGRLLAFSGVKNDWSELDLRSGETVIKSLTDGNVAVAYTSIRALGFSGITGRWSEERFRIRESVVSLSAEGNVATIVTDIRALGFSARTGNWVETDFDIID